MRCAGAALSAPEETIAAAVPPLSGRCPPLPGQQRGVTGGIGPRTARGDADGHGKPDAAPTCRKTARRLPELGLNAVRKAES